MSGIDFNQFDPIWKEKVSLGRLGILGCVGSTYGIKNELSVPLVETEPG